MVDVFDHNVGIVDCFRQHERALQDDLDVPGQTRDVDLGIGVGVGEGTLAPTVKLTSV